VSAVWGYVSDLEDRAFRRLQLAAEQTGSVGLLIRPRAVLSQPSWAAVRLLVEPRKSSASFSPRFRVETVRCHGGVSGSHGEFDIDTLTGSIRGASGSHETNSVRVAPQLARSTNRYRKAGNW